MTSAQVKDLLTNSSRRTEQSAQLKCLVFWTEENKTSIININNVKNETDRVEGRTTQCNWKKNQTFEATILKISESRELLEGKQLAINEELDKQLNLKRKSSEKSSTQGKAKQAKVQVDKVKPVKPTEKSSSQNQRNAKKPKVVQVDKTTESERPALLEKNKKKDDLAREKKEQMLVLREKKLALVALLDEKLHQQTADSSSRSSTPVPKAKSACSSRAPKSPSLSPRSPTPPPQHRSRTPVFYRRSPQLPELSPCSPTPPPQHRTRSPNFQRQSPRLSQLSPRSPTPPPQHRLRSPDCHRQSPRLSQLGFRDSTVITASRSPPMVQQPARKALSFSTAVELNAKGYPTQAAKQPRKKPGPDECQQCILLRERIVVLNKMIEDRDRVAHENDLDRSSKSRPAAGVYSDAEFAARNGMVKLVVGSCVYLHEDQLHTAKNKGASNDGRKIARFLLNVFFRKETLAKSSITSSEMAKYDPLDFTTTEAIIAFSILHSQTKRSDILRAMRSTLTSYRTKRNSAQKKQNRV